MLRRRYPFPAIILAALILALSAIPSMAAEPPTEPILRIETGMHTAVIKMIGVDASNRWLVTASGDKTVRVWSLPEGRLVRVIRPPVGEGNEGNLYAVTISPDGRTVACGGWTQYEGGALQAVDYNIYLFDRETGRLIRRLPGLPNVIDHLVFSRDGRYLTATLGRGQGLLVYRTSDYSLAGQDNDYGSDSYGADFDSGGRLATTCFDGYVRLYNSDFRFIAKAKPPGGQQPFSVAFSPDGSKIAVGFNDSVKVDLLSGRDLSHLYSPDTSGADRNLMSAAWSADGLFLYAGGMYYNNGFPIRRWSSSGKGSYRDLTAAENTIMHILPLKDGGIIFGAYDPAFGIIDREGRRVLFRGPQIADYRDILKELLVFNDASIVQFGYEKWGKSPARFSVTEHLLEIDPAKPSNLYPPRTEAPGLAITDWKYTYEPKLNGNPLKLDQYEMSRSLAIAPDNQSFLLGADWSLRLFAQDGRELWNVPVPGVAWGVNISGNGKTAVAAFSDGTIRWYRMSDGKELLAFFPHKDRKTWMLWSPSGYYDASPGGQELAGWHVNRGKDEAADFFPLSRFRAAYYRPDVVAKILEQGDEQEAVRLANDEAGRKSQAVSVERMLPPVVTILDPRDGAFITSPQLTLRYALRSPSGEPVTAVKALVDGRPLSISRGISIEGRNEESQQMAITIPERDCEVSLIAENRYAASEPATVRLRWKGEAPKEEFIVKPKLYVLAAGVGRYTHKGIDKLDFAAKDAVDFANVMKKQQAGLYREVEVKLLTDETATRDEIVDGLDWIRKETTSKDVAIVFLAGHGLNDQSGIYYFLPVNTDPDKLMRTAVPFSDIKNTVASLAGKTVLFVDTCHAGNVMGKRRGGVDITGFVNELASAENGAVVFASSTGRQYSLEDPAWGNGAFTKAVVEGLSGKADYHKKGKITINMLDLFISERVKELTKGQQTPTTTKPQTVPDFPIAVVF